MRTLMLTVVASSVVTGIVTACAWVVTHAS